MSKKNNAPTTDIKIVAQTDPQALTTDAEVTHVETAEVDGKAVEVLTIDETPKIVVTDTTDTIFVKLRDGSSCWGGGKFFISGTEIKKFPAIPFVLDGIVTGALLECDAQGRAL